MEEQIRRLSERFGWNLSDDEIHRIATEAVVQEQMLERLKQVDLAQTRPIMGVFKSRRSEANSRGRK